MKELRKWKGFPFLHWLQVGKIFITGKGKDFFRERRLHYLVDTLQKISGELLLPYEEEKLYQLAVATVMETFQAGQAVLLLSTGENSQEIESRIVMNLPREIVSFRLVWEPAWTDIIRDLPCPIPVRYLPPEFQDRVEKIGELILPLLSQSLVGLLILGKVKRKMLSPAELNLLSTITNQMVLILEKKKLQNQVTQLASSLETRVTQAIQQLNQVNRELRKRIFDLHNLFNISREISSILNIEELLNAFVFTVLGQLACRSVVLLLLDDGDEFVVRRHKGVDEQKVRFLRVHRENPLAKFLAGKMEPITLQGLENEPILQKEFLRFKELGLSVCAPLPVKNEIKGLIALGNKVTGEDFLRSDLELLSVLVNQVAVALDNARLFKEVEQLSITDQLTNLYNYRYFMLRLKEEITRAERFHHFMALLMVDIDYFKYYNDTLGHQMGNMVLKQLSLVLQSSVRDIDIVARYGGEEFGIIIPEVSKEQAYLCGERIRRNIERYPFPQAIIQPGGKLTASVGISTYPDDARTVEELIRKADIALYEAKNAGRNRVKLFSISQARSFNF